VRIGPPVLALTLFSAIALPCIAQTPSLICQANSGVPPVVRQSGVTELLSDIVLNCLGAGTGSVTTDLKFDFDFPVTSRNYNPGTEAVLLVDEPNGAHLNDDGTCCYTPPLRAGINLISAEPISGSSITFRNVSVPVPAPGRVTTLRLVNVRGDMTGVPRGSLSVVTTVKANITASAVVLDNPQQTVGFIQQPVFTQVSLPSSGLSGACAGHNQLLANSPASSGGIIDLALNIKEGFQTALKTRIGADAQNVPGQIFNAESGFFDTSLPASNGYDRLGLADFSTRIRAAFSNIPAGAALYVTTGPIAWTGKGTATGIRLLNASGVAATPTTSASWESKQYPISPVLITNGAGVAEWEILASDQSELDSYQVGVLVAYSPGTTAATAPRVDVSLGPAGPATAVPRFSAADADRTLLPVGPCTQGVDLMLTGVTGQGFTNRGLSGGQSQVMRLGVVNRGTSASAPVTLQVKGIDTAAGNAEQFRYTTTIPGLLAGEAKTVTAHVRIPLRSASGTWTTVVTLDPNRTTGDVDVSNNALTSPAYRMYCGAPPAGNLVASAGSVGYLQWLDLLVRNSTTCGPYDVHSFNSWLRVYSTTITVDSNRDGDTRTGEVCWYSGNYILHCQTVTQAYLDQGCTLTAAPSSVALVSATGETRSVAYQTGATCKWTAVGDPRGAVPDGGIFTGNKTLNVIFRPNFGTSSRTLDITGAIFVQAANTRPLNERLIQLIYYYFLGRMPSDAEIAFQAGALNGTDLEDFMPRFLNALEFDMTSRYVAGLYVGLLNRNAEFNGFLWQRSAMLTGAASGTQLVDNFLNALEWKLRFGTPDNAAYVRLLYQNVLLRAPTQAEVDFHAGNLTNGQTRTQLASNFLNSAEFRVGTGPNLTAFLLYAAVLGRDTVRNEFNTLVDRLKGGLAVTDAMTELIASPEFAAIVD
jgi:hypothetical protein